MMTSFWNAGSSSLSPCFSLKPARTDITWKPASPLGSMMACRHGRSVWLCAAAAVAPTRVAASAVQQRRNARIFVIPSSRFPCFLSQQHRWPDHWLQRHIPGAPGVRRAILRRSLSCERPAMPAPALKSSPVEALGVDLEKFRLRHFVEALAGIGEVETHDEPVALGDLSKVIESSAKATHFKRVGAEQLELIAAVSGGRKRIAA